MHTHLTQACPTFLRPSHTLEHSYTVAGNFQIHDLYNFVVVMRGQDSSVV